MPSPEGHRPAGPPICPARTGIRLVPPTREYEPGHGQGHPPSPRCTAPPPRPHWAGGPGAGTSAGRGARPSSKDVLASRGDPRGGHHRGIPGIAPGIAVLRRRANSTGGRAWPTPRCQCPRHNHAALTVPSAPGIHRSRVDNYLAPVRTLSLPDLLATQPANGICPGGGRQDLPGHVPVTAPRSRRIYAQFIDGPCAQPPTLVISPGLA